MTKKAIKNYQTNNPQKANTIKKAVNRGLKEYAETFKRLATA